MCVVCVLCVCVVCVCISPSFSTVDYEKVIAHCIQQHKFEDALKTLTEKASEALQAPEGVRSQGEGWNINVTRVTMFCRSVQEGSTGSPYCSTSSLQC